VIFLVFSLMGGKSSKTVVAEPTDSRPYNIVVIGNGGVGKTALTVQFVQDKFIKDYDPTIENSYRKQVMVDGQVAVLNIWDTAGQEEYEVLLEQYIKDADGFLLVYSVTAKNSFASLQKYWKKILMVRGGTQQPVAILGNKADLEDQREVTTGEGSKFAVDICGKNFKETSALTKQNVEDGFFSVIRQIRESRRADKQQGSGKKK